MFLAIKEIKHEKLRYGLIIGMVMLISYLVYFLNGLATGLAEQNTQAIKTWNIKQIVLNKDANLSLTQSIITTDQVKKVTLTKNESYIGQAPVIIKKNGLKSISSQFVGLEKNSEVFNNIKLTEGRKVKKTNELVADESLKYSGYGLNDQVKLSSSIIQYKIVGFTKNAKLNIAPVIYGDLNTWRILRSFPNTFKASGIVSSNKKNSINNSQIKTYSVDQFINKLPGYQAQSITFFFMITFLIIISMVVIAIFFYILTIQKLPNYGVLRAQGIPAHILIYSTICQSILIVTGGIIIGGLLTFFSVKILPKVVPIAFDYKSLLLVTIGMLLTGVVGSLIPIHLIKKVDPIKLIH